MYTRATFFHSCLLQDCYSLVIFANWLYWPLNLIYNSSVGFCFFNSPKGLQFSSITKRRFFSTWLFQPKSFFGTFYMLCSLLAILYMPDEQALVYMISHFLINTCFWRYFSFAHSKIFTNITTNCFQFQHTCHIFFSKFYHANILLFRSWVFLDCIMIPFPCLNCYFSQLNFSKCQIPCFQHPCTIYIVLLYSMPLYGYFMTFSSCHKGSYYILLFASFV